MRRSRLHGLAGRPPGPVGPASDRAGRRGRRGTGTGSPGARHGAEHGLAGHVLETAAALRSGGTPEAAWARVGVRVVDGVPRPDDLATLGASQEDHLVAVLAAARLSAHAGVAPAVVLERVAAGVASDAQAAAAQRAALAGPRSSARLLAWLPAAGLVMGAALGARPWEVLLDGGAGSALLITGAVLTWVGRRWTQACLRAAQAAGRAR